MITGRKKQNSIWWGPPKKFTAFFEERKVSWLELFYDLVYVIVISRTTHYLAEDPDMNRVIDYLLLFGIIFWGWLNGSLYYDLHGTLGIRTRLMMLWQMMAVAALAVTLGKVSEAFMSMVIYTLIFLQAYITYLWWSIGIYDKDHRKINRPFTICYLAALALIALTLFLQIPYIRILFALALVFNFLPSFLVLLSKNKQQKSLLLSPRMVERLGLLTIIVFGEVILGVINGTGRVTNMDPGLWICFGLGIAVVFALWWIFFSLVADREVKKEYIKGQIMALLYVPALASLGMVGAAFSGLINGITGSELLPHFHATKTLFGGSLAIFLLSICAISRFLQYPEPFKNAPKILIPVITSVALLIFLVTIAFKSLPLSIYLLFIFLLLSLVIAVITRLWFNVEIKKLTTEDSN